MIVRGIAPRGRRVRVLALQTSAMLGALLVSEPAFAGCTPDPTVANATTNCTGTDSDGLTVNGANSRVIVAQGATVRPGNASAAILSRSTSATFQIDGLVDGGAGKPGMFISTGPVTTVPCDPYAGASPIYCIPGSSVTSYPSANVAMTVGPDGKVNGAQGIVIRRDPGNSNGNIYASVHNRGTISGTAGPAIVADQLGFGTLTITNSLSGKIGGIAGNLSYLDNAGTIDGNNNSAIVTTYQGSYINNISQIVSSGQVATISSTGHLSVNNAAGAIIGGGTTAIQTAGALTLTNLGTINGSVISAVVRGPGSYIDTRIGTINGDLLLGTGGDTLRALYDTATGRISSITGIVDGGDGIDTIIFGVDSNATFHRALLPTNFEQIGFDLNNDAVATLAADFTSATAIQISGTGTVVNQATLITNGAAITSGYSVSGLTFDNQGSVVSTTSFGYVHAASAPVITNSGSIISHGGSGVNASSRLTNSGLITADGTGALVDGQLINSGSIRSTGGSGVHLNGWGTSTNSGTIIGNFTGLTFSSGSFINNGTITGELRGLSLNGGRLTNSGTITGGSVGASVNAGTLVNSASGRIVGGISNGGGRAMIANAGHIAGRVDLTSPFLYDFSNDIFIDDGGSVAGAIQLGGGDDQLVVDLNGPVGRALAGAAGGVDAGAGWDMIRYRVRSDASATLALTGGFEALAYELSNDAKLALSAASPIVTTIGLAGTGTVTLSGSVSISDRNLIDATILTVDQLTGAGSGPARALTIVNDGTLALTGTAQTNGYQQLAAIYAGTADVTNNGLITVTNAAGRYFPASAIFGGTTVSNNGTIRLIGYGTAISGARDIVNSGTITDVAGSNAIGVTGFTTLNNSGTIRMDGVAVQSTYYSSSSLTNSGTIESRRAAAIAMAYGATLTNEAGGMIRGATAIDLSNGGAIINRGAISGNITTSQYSYSQDVYIADGGTLTGNLTFGQGNDLFIQTSDSHGVTGTIDGGADFDIFGYVRKTSGTVALGNRPGINFEVDFVEASGADTSVTLTSANSIANDVYVQGDGAIINEASIDGALRVQLPYYMVGQSFTNQLSALTNRGTVLGGVNGDIRSISNSGTIGSATLANYAVSQWNYASDAILANGGTIMSGGAYSAVAMGGNDLTGLSAINSGSINGGLYARANFVQQPEPAMMTIDNSGTISSTVGAALTIVANNLYAYPPYAHGAVAISLTNSGTIQTTGAAASGVSIQIAGNSPSTYAIDNRGTIRATGDGVTESYGYWTYPGYVYTTATYTIPTTGLDIQATGLAKGTVTNSGTIETTGVKSVAVMVSGKALDLHNSGTIRGGGDTTMAADDLFARSTGSTSLAGAIQTFGTANDRIVNSGTIIGAIDLGRGNDRIENYGRIEGDVRLGAGDDSFLQAADAVLIGTVDGGEGTDSLIVDATRGGAVNGDQFVNFERFSQIGNGAVAYSGNFRFDSIGLSGGTVTVAAGQTLSSTGATTIAGGDGAESVINAGTITGTVDLGAGNDRVVNSGTIGGAVLLGAGDDQFVEMAGSNVAGGVDGGAGNDLYTVMLAGNRSGIGRRTGFERLAVDGNGTLTLTLDQNFEGVALNGTGLDLTLNGFGAGVVTGSDGAETLSVDGDVAVAMMGAGDDMLAIGAPRAAGLYAGGAGADMLRFTANAPVTLAGVASGFENIALTNGSLTITGTLGAANEAIGFGDGGQSVSVANGGTLAGIIDLGNGNDNFRLAAGATLAGTVHGGAGIDSATLELAGDRMLGTGLLTGFEILGTDGSGTLTLNGNHAYERVAANTGLTVAAGASLSAPVIFGAGDNRFTIVGAFAGSVDGGAGNDIIQLSGGSSAAPVAFSNVANVEGLTMTGGYATVSGSAAFGTIDLSGGRLVGLAGSIIRAGQIAVRTGATFGSAGTVNGNISVSGTLSPGASPGIMTVNGNVALASGSTSLFEITPTIADQLLVNGNVTIASGATLRIVAEGQIRPGTSYDLIVASGGITGSYTTIDKAASLFGFVVQRADRIQLLGQFLDNAAFSPPVSRSIAYANTAIQAQPATSTLFAALPSLLLADGSSDPRGFARLTPEPYASATQLGVDQALTLVDVARGSGFAAIDSDDVRPFTFGQVMGQWHSLGGDTRTGTSAAQTRGYGLIGGIGIGNRDWSVGAFGGTLDSRQRIGALAASNHSDGFVAGVLGRYAANGVQVAASALFSDGDAHTTRALPNGDSASARYDLRSWVGDLSVGYALSTGGDWALTPRVGVTFVRTIRDRAVETGSIFGLTVARDRHDAIFGDAGFRFARADASDAAFRPYVGFGLRAQYNGRMPTAIGGYAGAPLTLIATGAQRAKMVGTVSAGLSYRLNSGLELFSAVDAQTGSDDHRESVMSGMRLRF